MVLFAFGVTYTIPKLPKGVTEERLPVLSIEHDGGRYCTIRRTKTFYLTFSITHR